MRPLLSKIRSVFFWFYYYYYLRSDLTLYPNMAGTRDNCSTPNFLNPGITSMSYPTNNAFLTLKHYCVLSCLKWFRRQLPSDYGLGEKGWVDTAPYTKQSHLLGWIRWTKSRWHSIMLLRKRCDNTHKLFLSGMFYVIFLGPSLTTRNTLVTLDVHSR